MIILAIKSLDEFIIYAILSIIVFVITGMIVKKKAKNKSNKTDNLLILADNEMDTNPDMSVL